MERIHATLPPQAVELVPFITQGDQHLDKGLPELGGKGAFTLELEKALRAGDIDLAVHSLKDLPTQMDAALTLGAVLERGSPLDALMTRARCGLDDLKHGAVIGTSSLRRAAQLRAYRGDFVIQPMRGNVETRVRKTHDAEREYDAAVLAVAGLERRAMTGVMGLDGVVLL